MYHKHHIIPRHAGGTNDPSNLVSLTVEEHAEAHRELYETHNRKEDYIAWKALSGQMTQSEASAQAQALWLENNPEEAKRMQTKATQAALKSRKENPERFINANKEYRLNNPEAFQSQREAAVAKVKVEVGTPDGIFGSFKDAADFYDTKVATIRYRANNNIKGFYRT